MKTIVFLSVRGGVGKTSLVFNLAYILSRMGYPTLAVDLDPQADLSSMFLDAGQLRAAWEPGMGTSTVFSSLVPVFEEQDGQVHPPEPLAFGDSLWGLVGGPALWELELPLAEAWVKGLQGDASALNGMSSLARLLKHAGESTQSAVALIDLGAGIGALNRAAVIASDFLVLALNVDAFTAPGLQVVGQTLGQWREQWRQIRALNPSTLAELPLGQMTPAGYTVLRDTLRSARYTSRAREAEEIAFSYSANVLGQASFGSIEEDSNCLSILRNYASLIPMARDAHIPIFDLSPSTGALGSYAQLVRQYHDDFERLAQRLVDRCGLDKPSSP